MIGDDLDSFGSGEILPVSWEPACRSEGVSRGDVAFLDETIDVAFAFGHVDCHLRGGGFEELREPIKDAIVLA